MTVDDPNSVSDFLVEASERLQFVREYAAVLVEPHASQDELSRLYEETHKLVESAARRGFVLFAEIAAKLEHIFQYARKTELSPETYGPLTEFLADAVTVLEFDLLQISADGKETADDIQSFKHRYSFAFPEAQNSDSTSGARSHSDAGAGEPVPDVFAAGSGSALLPEDQEVPKEVLEFFIPEAEEHLHAATQSLLTLESNPSAEEINRLFRAVHTIKGSAAQVGLRRLAAVAHRLEDLIGKIRDGALSPTPEIVDVCLKTIDTLRKFLQNEWADDAEMLSAIRPLLAKIANWAPADSADDAAVSAHSSSNAPGETAASASDAAHAGGDSAAAGRAAQIKSVRISLHKLDEMMDGVGELVINRTRLVGRMVELKKLVEVLGLSRQRLANKIADFQDKYEFNRIAASLQGADARPSWSQPAIDSDGVASSSSGSSQFTELEMDRYDDFNILARSLTEISADVSEVVSQLGGFAGRVGGDIDEFTKLAHHLQDGITQARMVPIGHLYTRLTRTVRDAALVCGKQVELQLDGSETQLDNNIIQQITDPLIHLVRNAVSHGIEDSGERGQAGKPAAGRVTVRAFHRGNHVFIEIEDDGRGLVYPKIRERAVHMGLISPSVAEQLSERELRAFLFQPGFTTASEKTEIAGRGVGLDVVQNNVHALNGEIEIRSEVGRGACFIVKVPLTLIISQALFVRFGSNVFAMPLAVVEEIRRLRPADIEDVGGKLFTRVRNIVTEIIRLDAALGLPPLEPVNGFFRMVIVHVAGRQVGIVVEEVLGKDEVVIKNLGEYLRRVKLFPGATISTDGSLILLIDINRLVAGDTSERNVVMPSASAARIFAPGAAAVASGSIPAAAMDELRGEKVVVVADDSISVRKFVGRMLEKAGYRVKLASDGQEAAELIAQVGCHLLLTDIEMPRMNGYDLMAHLRMDPATRRIPVLVVTSRAGAKHRERAMKEGASNFLTKPVQEDQLLTVVSELIGSPSEQSQPAAPALDRA